VSLPALLPLVTDETRFFWEAGRDGTLRIARCRSCGFFSHPPYPRCPCCTSADVGPAAVSGNGTIYSFTVKETPEGAAVIALVELDEQLGLRLLTNVVECDPAAVRIGLRVRVQFRAAGDVWLPLFVPAVA
jgi:uncharacterized OB-fold protein